MNPKFSGLLGLAMRAGALVCGESKVTNAVRSEKCSLLIVASDASENTKKKFGNMSSFRSVKIIFPAGKAELGKILGKTSVVSAAVNDEGFASQLYLLSDMTDKN